MQWIRTGHFRLFDHGSKAANRRAYGESEPPDIAGSYGMINIPVDIVAGKADGVIAPQNVRKHVRLLQEAGRQVCLLSKLLHVEALATACVLASAILPRSAVHRRLHCKCRCRHSASAAVQTRHSSTCRPGCGAAQVTFREFSFGHLDFTIASKDDLRHFVLQRLRARH